MDTQEPLKTIVPNSSLAKRVAIRALRLYGKTLPKNPLPFPPPGNAEVRILIQSMGGIGNTLMATPLIAATRTLYPNAQIDLLTSPGAAHLLAKDPHLSNLIPEQSGDDHSKSRYRQINRILRGSGYDAALLTLNAVTFRFAARSVLARIPWRLIHAYDFRSYDDYTSAFTHHVPRNKGAHDVECNIDLLRVLSGAEAGADELTLVLGEDENREARDTLISLGWEDTTPTVGLCPGSSGWMAFKRWPLNSYIELAKKIVNSIKKVNLVTFLGPDERDEVPVWKRELQGLSTILVEGLPLLPYAGALSLCNVVITNDSLPMHICAALQVPTVGLFGPTNANQTGPWKCPATVIVADTDYAPYFRIPYPPNPSRFPDCMSSITTGEVLAAVMDRLV